MNIRKSVYSEIAKRSGTNVTAIDIGGLVEKLLLFDRVVLRSVRLREVPFLVRALGKTGFIELINLGILDIVCEFTSTITGIAQNGLPSLPPFHYSFGTVEIANREFVLKSELRALQGIPGLHNAERSALEETIITKLKRPPANYAGTVLSQVDLELRKNTPAFESAVLCSLKKKLGRPVQKVELNVYEEQERVFRVESNLTTDFGLKPNEAQGVIAAATLAIAGASHRIADMQAYSAITGFSDDEAPILFGKLHTIMGALNPRPLEDAFQRVLALADIPDFSGCNKVDVDRLLNIRDSSECVEFRNWLSTVENATDSEILNALESYRSKAGAFLRSGLGKSIRFVTTTAIGLVPPLGPAISAGLGALDMFLLDKIFPSAGIVAFLAKKYPSIFEP